MILLQNKLLLQCLTGFNANYKAITLWPLVIVKSKEIAKNKRILNHERIHLAQQKELLVLGFYFCYLIEFLFLLLKNLNWHKAYLKISFEKEAYKNENNFTYLVKRKIFNQWRSSYDKRN